MIDRENLPAVISQQVAVHSGQRGSLVIRGLVAVQESKALALTKDNDALYRQARTIFNEWAYAEERVDGRLLNEIKAPDLFVAFKDFQQLANNNYGKAYFPLSALYCIVDGDSWDQIQHFAQLAMEWCLANQANQDVELWSDLGDMYRNGIGTAKDDVLAAYWFLKAAEQGNNNAQFNLGRMYNQGQGVPQDYGASVEWYRKAAEQENDMSQRYLDSCGIDWRKQDAS
jgi:hypothetical protein